MDNVLITGGTSGIGYSLAKIFAINKYNVVIVSSNFERLRAAQQKLMNELSVPITIYEQDLSQIGSAGELYQKLKSDNIEVNILVNNAGYGVVGRTEEIDFDMDERMMILNMLSLVELCKLVLPDMYSKKAGKILNISSTGAFQPGPFTSTYFASKSFVLSYSKAIRYEAEMGGVQVCTLCPGATRTNFFNREGIKTPSSAMAVEDVADYGFKRLMRNKSESVPGFFNKAMRLLPKRLRMVAVAKIKGQ